MSKKKYFRASTCYFIGNIFDKALAFITVPIYTRLLSTTEYGLLATYLSWASIITIVITLSAGSSIRTAIYDYKDDIDGYLSSIFMFSTVCGFVISVCVILLFRIIKSTEPIYVIGCVCICAFGNSVLGTIQLRYMMEVKYVKRTVIQCMPNVLTVILSVFLIQNLSNERHLGKLYAHTIVSLLFATGFIVLYLIRGKRIYSIEYWKYAATFSLPLIFHSLSNVILSQADRTMLTKMTSATETAIYSIAYQFGMIPLAITTTLENIWIPWFTDRLSHGDKISVNKMGEKYIMIATLLCVETLLVSPEVLKVMTTPDYYKGVYTIPPIVLATFFMFLTSVSIDFEYYLKKTRIIAMNTLVAAIINITLNALFIPMYGSVAAGYTTLISYLISFLMHYLYTRRMDMDLFSFNIYIKPISIMIVAAVISNAYMNNCSIRWLAAFLMGMLSFLLYRRELLASVFHIGRGKTE